jgi:regulation of enolase protein 1 (concanavalin A-like superfamily)
VWTFEDPLGDGGAYTLTGTNTPDAWINISVPSGTSHEVWDSGIQVPHIWQAANDVDFEVEFKLESSVNLQYQEQGMFVRENSGDYLRFEFYSTTSETRIIAASFVSMTPEIRINSQINTTGVAPLYMRVERTGDLWTQAYSYDGTTWTNGAVFTHSINVTAVGIYAGNAGANPAHTASFDYFFNTESPVIPEDPSLPWNISDVQAAPSDTEATITWTTNELTNSAVAYGLTTAYEIGTETAPAYVENHTIVLTGLTPGTTYHYQVTSEDMSSNAISTGDYTFTTTGIDTSGIVSDDFNSTTLDPMWEWVDPLSDASYSLTGEGTDDAWLNISVPAGVEHQVYTGGIEAAHILQTANDTDFEVEVKFESAVALQYQEQGIVVKEDAGNYLRLEFFSTTTSTVLYARGFTPATSPTYINTTIASNGTAPLYMRAGRQGDQWTVSYSFDGTTWTSMPSFVHAMTVTQIGPYSGNAVGGGSPAHTTSVDYFFNTASPIVPEDGPADTTPPTMEPILEAEGGDYNTAPSFANFGFDDDVALDTAEYQIDSNGWVAVFTNLNLAEYNDDGWVLPGFAALSEGTHTVYFRVSDTAGNTNGEGTPNTYNWSFNKDTVAPDAATDFAAAPGHDKVRLTWTNPQGDSTFVGVEIRVAEWTDYPEYTTAEPSYPATRTEGTLVTQTSAESYDDNPRTPRGICYYSIFAYDAAGNYSALGTEAADRSTSYWLGDIGPAVVGDGTVDMSDLALFSGAFGESDGDPGWLAEADFGPTDDWTAFGVPVPDDVVDFEDLMIFSINYGNVAPTAAPELVAIEPFDILRQNVSFRLVPKSARGRNAVFSILMENSSKTLKGASLLVDCGMGAELTALKTSPTLAGTQSFLGSIERENGMFEICISALGVNKPLTVTGEIAEIEVRPGGDGTAGVRLVRKHLRNLANEGDEVGQDAGRTPYVPVVSRLMQNNPNPFNPTTVITYDIATPGHVRIDVFDVTGRLVRTLVNEEKGTGRYETFWDARDANGTPVHSGIYFYRMTASGYQSPAKKMLLLK